MTEGVMTKSSCPTHQLHLLVDDQLSPGESGPILSHLEECAACQSELETLSADDTWWQRTTQNLSGVSLNTDGQLPIPRDSICSIEALLGQPLQRPQSYSPKVIEAMLDAPSHPEMLGRIDEFDIEEKVGHGGMGIVFRGFDRSLNRPVAIKVMSPQLAANGIARKRFAREAQAAAAVVHPNVVPIYRVNSSPERPYIAMALIDGLSLQDHVTTNGPFEIKDVVRIAIQTAGGLAAAHKHGLVHRDIKPANILMEKDVSRVMITDFGLARAIDDVAMTQSGCLAGTPNYMSPEQVVGEDIDHRSDLFSLGGVIYFLATGREPFRAENAFAVINKVMRSHPVSARTINADIPEVLDRIINRLLAKKRGDRIDSAEELQQLLTQHLAHLQDPDRHTEPRVKKTRTERNKEFKRLGWLLAVLGLAVALWSASHFGFMGDQSVNDGGPGNQERAGHHDAEHHSEGEEHHKGD